MQVLKQIKKPVRTISGITPLTVVAAPFPCPHGKCIYCPGSKEVPNSYTNQSPAIMRALAFKYDVAKQIEARLRAFAAMGHAAEKIEIIIIGGTFLAMPKNYKYDFVKALYDSLNGETANDLDQAKRINEKAKHRCVAFCIETKPDVCNKKDIDEMLNYGCTRVELGVQIPDNRIYKIINRGHTVKDVIKATQLLKDSGYKVGYHFMPGLPGSNFNHDIKKFRELFENSNFMPDHLKIYPTVIVKNSPLEKIYKKINYVPYSDEELLELLIELHKIVPRWCRIMRVMRQFPPSQIVSGTKRSDFRRIVELEMRKRGLKCVCIRCREVGFNEIKDKSIFIEKIEYVASNSKEIYLEATNSEELVFGVCRLRIPFKPYRNEITSNSLLLRELHVYGKEAIFGAKEWQHSGIGKMLLAEAEAIAKDKGFEKIVVISGVGVRNYFRRFGYQLEGPYMVKYIN